MPPDVSPSDSLQPALSWLRARTWRAPRTLAVTGLLLAMALIYWPSSLALEGLWTDTQDRAYTHGFLVLLICLWLLWRRRAWLESLPVRPDGRALVAVLLLSAVWVLAWRAAIQDLSLLVLPGLLLVAVLAVLGPQPLRAVAFPIGYLCFALPFWSDLVDPLQSLSVKVNAALIWLTGLPAYVQGDFIHVPAGTLEVAGGCSGLHFVVVGLALAALYGELLAAPLARRLMWVVLMGVIALTANWVRIFVIVVAAYATDMRSFLITVDHYWFGWGVFVCGVGFFGWVVSRSAGKLPTRRTDEPVGTAPIRRGEGLRWGRWTATLLTTAVLPLLAYAHAVKQDQVSSRIEIDWRPAPAGWSGPRPGVSSAWRPQFIHATAAELRRYTDPTGNPVEVFEVVYRRQRQGFELVNYDNSVLGSGPSQRLLGERIVRTPEGAWREDRVVDEAGVTSLIWSRYTIGRRNFVSPHASQLWYGLSALAGAPLSSLTAMRVVCATGCARASGRLEAGARNLAPQPLITRALR